MQKRSIVGLVLVLVIIIGLLVFASTYKYKDNHLRIDGYRVRIKDTALNVLDCDSLTKTVAYCQKTVKINNEEIPIEIKFKDFKENGYPNKLVMVINNQELVINDKLEMDSNPYLEYQYLDYFIDMGSYLIFTYTNGSNGLSTTIYVIDKEGNIKFKLDEEDDFKIKDSTDFLSVNDNTFTVYMTKIRGAYNFEDVCELDANEVVEGYFTYKLVNNEFKGTLTKTIKAKEYISNNGINCNATNETESMPGVLP